MNASEALVVAGNLENLFKSGRKNSYEINSILQRSLTKEEYIKLCKKIRKMGTATKKFPKRNFKDGHTHEHGISDWDIVIDFSFGMFLLIISEILD